MNKYQRIVTTTWQEYFQYRINFFLEILGGIITAVVILFLWLKIYESSGSIQIGGYSISEMITYIIGGGIISSFVLLTAQGDEIDDDINEGTLSYFLVKPMNSSFYWFVRDQCRKFFTLFLGLSGFLIILIFARSFLVLPQTNTLAFLALFAIFLGGIIHFILFYIFSIISFWLGRTWGFRFMIRVVMEIATGAMIPLSLLPGIWRIIIEAMPFKYLVYFPMQIYLGKISTTGIIQNLTYEIIWLVGLVFIGWVIWKQGIKRYTAVGG